MPKSYSFTVAAHAPRRGSAGERALHWLAIGGPIGLIPWVPATIASALVALVCRWFPPGWPVVAGLTLALWPVGAWAASTAERLLGDHDPRNVVIDEIAGQLLTFLFVAPTSWAVAGAGFVLFRALDVLKPFPADRAERLPGGWGIMTDDLVAGLYGALALYLIRRWLG